MATGTHAPKTREKSPDATVTHRQKASESKLR